MFDQVIENLRKMSDSTLQIQQEALRYWTQPWATVPNLSGASAESAKNAQQQWANLMVEMLHRQRESLESAWKTGINIVEQTVRSSADAAQSGQQSAQA